MNTEELEEVKEESVETEDPLLVTIHPGNKRNNVALKILQRIHLNIISIW